MTWRDYAWGHPEDFFRRMTKEVVQSVWYYGTTYDVSKLRDADKQERYWKTKIKTYDKLEAAGFDQIPCGSNYSNDVNFGLTVDYCRVRLSPERLKGFLMASWFFTTKGFRNRHLQSVRQVSAAMAKVVSCLLVSLMAIGSAVAEDVRVSFAEPNIVPRPQSIFVETNRCVRIDAATPVSVTCGTNAAAAVTRVRASFRTYFGFVPSATPCSGPVVPGGPEAYRLTADAAGIRIEANAENGVAYALSTLRQSAIAARGTLKTTGYVLPGLQIEDAPVLAFRGIHFCWFPGVTARQMERYVRMAAYYKFNHVVIEPWGVFKWKRHPAFCWPDAYVTADDMQRLARLGRELGVTLLPQLNVFGHAAMSRFVGGKHATLDFGREYEPVFEPLGGWNWCLTNPETRRILFDMADELLAAFENPPYFHIGCDEAEEPSCPNCRAVPYAKLVTDHITAVRDHLAAHGARPLMWHDMLLDSADRRWEGFYARGNAATATMAVALPRDVVVCDWYYGGPAKAYPTLAHFKERGFETLTCPWMNLEGIAAQAAEAKRLGLKGLLATTWNRAHGRPFAATLIADAHAGWGTSPARYAKSYGTIVCAGHLRQVGWDMGLTAKEETGFVNEDVPSRTAVGTVSD